MPNEEASGQFSFRLPDSLVGRVEQCMTRLEQLA